MAGCEGKVPNYDEMVECNAPIIKHGRCADCLDREMSKLRKQITRANVRIADEEREIAEMKTRLALLES